MKTSYHADRERNELARYQILMQHRQHIERIFWSRIQILHLIQAAVIGGSFYISYQKDLPDLFPPALLGFGIILTAVLFVLCKYDWKSAQVNEKRLHNLGDTLGITWSPRRWHICGYEIKAHIILYFVVLLFIIVDSSLMFYFIFNC